MIEVYNTLTRKKEEFHPVKEGEVNIYCCGVTPYNHPHIGNARPFVTWDVIRRFFKYKGYKVRYVQNFTDVDDKIIAKANGENSNWKEISDRYIASYFKVMDALNVKRASIYPRVSENMDDIIEMISGLIEKGYAYKTENGVYYSVEKFPSYGKLSGRNLEDNEAGARVETDETKRHPMDFALWKAAKPGEPAWESPFGAGRPGWHIECSAMSLKYLGETFDFHGGGSDLIFPHHENEIAQSEAYLGKNTFAKCWCHNGFITVHEEKMSKSKNNFFTVDEILQEFDGEVVRFFILGTHYRSPLDFSKERLEEARASLKRLTQAKETGEELLKAEGNSGAAAEILKKAKEYFKNFDEAMEDDFNTAKAVGEMHKLAKEINIFAAGNFEADKENFSEVMKIYLQMAGILGIFESAPEAASSKIDELIGFILDIRTHAKQDKNYEIADKIRNGLKEIGIVVEDTKQGVKWKWL
ncbi:MAG: cysteine--tRNA ligase [Selenomonadaceae bacterium]|nr:cysteine--tRNA ligase [Selenomonadaceae bacterium]